MSEISVRTAEPADAAAVAAIHVAGYEEAFRGMIPDEVIDARPLELRERVWRERLEQRAPDQFVIVVELDGHVVGFASGRAPEPEESDAPADGCWENLYLSSEHMATSVSFRAGMALQEEVVRRLLALGYTQGIAFVFEANERAQTFFRMMRWLPDGAEREVEGTHQLRIRRTLTTDERREPSR